METILFTDIEGSTRLWEEHGDAMAKSLARHDEILARTIDARNGRILKTTGDGMIAVFEDPEDGVRAAVVVQRELGAEPWDPSTPIRIRIGIHSGDTEQRGDDLFGPVMNRAARIMAAAHGGQILVSGTAADLARSHLPAETGFIDLGLHRLKDLTTPERLYQVTTDGLPSNFPPPRTLDGRPNNLPQQTTEFVGRESDLTAVQLMMDSPSARLVTITGPGGAGKTRLALQVAAEQLDRFHDGVFFVDLSTETTPQGVYEAMVRTLGLAALGSGEPLEVLATRLRDSHLLLVLDNFEQVLEASIGLVSLLQRVPNLELLVTSRESLRVRAEKVYPVPPMLMANPGAPASEIAEAESVSLFLDRAHAVRPDFVLTDDNAATIAEIVLRLDGLPLAIELAAARLNVFTPAELLTRIRERLDVLGSGGRDLPDRQRTLWGAIGWSYEMLTPGERDLFQTMSVFTSSTFEALESVTGSPEAIDTVGSLVDKSLVRSDDQGEGRRFSMLLMIKEYAASRLAESPERLSEARRRHAAHFAERAHLMAMQIEGHGRGEALTEAGLEAGNLATAWTYWVENADPDRVLTFLDDLWIIHEAKGWYRAAIDITTQALGLLGTSHPDRELTIRAARARAMMAVRGYSEEVEAEFQRVLQLAESNAVPSEMFPILRTLATYYMGRSEFSTAQEYGRRLIDLGEASNDPRIRMEGDFVYGVVTAFSGGVDEGMPYLDRAIQAFDSTTHQSSRYRMGPNTGVIAPIASGLILWQVGRLDEGIARVEHGLTVARTLDHPYSLAYALYHNGFLALLRGRHEEALGYSYALCEVAEDNDYVVWLTLGTVLEGVATSGMGDSQRGLEMTETGVNLYQGTIAPPVFWPLILALRAQVYALAGQLDRALQLANESVAIASPEPAANPDLRLIRGDILRMCGELSEARTAYEQAAEGSAQAGFDLVQLQAQTRLVELRREAGEPEIVGQLEAVYDRFDQGLEEIDLIRARIALGDAR